MSSLSNIRNRLHAVGNIKQITTSMEMVASARLRKAQLRAKQTQFYIAKMQELLEKINSAYPDFTHPLFIKRAIKKTGLVVVTSDQGLCGAYNTRVLAAADQLLKDQQPENVALTLLGRKAIHYYQHKKWKIQSQLPGWSGKITLAQVKELSEQLVKSFLSRHLDCIWLVYTKFYTLMHREVVVEKFLPLGQPTGEKRGGLSYIFEPNIEEIYEQLLPRYCMTKIESMLNEAYASELVARIFSMKTAAQNAQEMIEHLTLERNKIRQTGITREMLETTSSIK
jgi:F-type H+-transporting ATPase subunit gamma